MAKKTNIFYLFFVFLVFPLVLSNNELFADEPLILFGGQSTQVGLDAGLNNDTPTRKKIDLSGMWDVSFNGETWRQVKVPSSIDYEGWSAYKREFSLNDTLLASSVFKIVSLGINSDCEIYINDILIGKHNGGYNSFEYEIPEGVLKSNNENRIQIFVQNNLNVRTTIPPMNQIWGWKNYNGIIRDIYVLATPRLWIDDIQIRTSLNELINQGMIQFSGVVNNRDYFQLKDSTISKAKQASYILTAEIFDRFSEILVTQLTSPPLVIEPEKETPVNLTVPINAPKMWSTNTPDLYQIKLSIVMLEGKTKTVIDQCIKNIGFTSIRLANTDFIINGVKTPLKGVVWHEDFPGYGISMTYEQMEKDVILIKSLGANVVRCAFHPPHPYFLSLCNRYGLFVFEEMPVWNVPSDMLVDEIYQARVETLAREALERDAINPCLLAWGIGDQFDSADKRTQIFIQRIVKTIKSLDSRPVYFGSNMFTNDVCTSDVDFTALTLPTTDLKNFRKMLTDWKKNHSGQPVVLLSYGKEVDQRNHNGYSDPMSQEAQARFFMQYYAATKEVEISGSFINAFADWQGGRPLLTIDLPNHYLYPIGLLSERRTKRLAFDIVQALYTNDRINPLPIGGYKSNFPVVHILTGLLIIVLVGYQYSYNRRFGEALKRALFRSYNFFVDLRDLRAVSVLHTLFLSFLIAVTLSTLLSSIMYHYRVDKLVDYIMTYLLVSDVLKEQFIFAVWHPFLGILGFTLMFFLLGCLFALSIKIIAMLIRVRVSWTHVYSVSVWGATPIIFLSPLAMCLFKILQNTNYVIPSLVIIIIFLLWTIIRMLKGISVMYDLSPVKIYIGGVFVCIVVLSGLYFYYQSVYGIDSYVKFIAHEAKNLG